MYFNVTLKIETKENITFPQHSSFHHYLPITAKRIFMTICKKIENRSNVCILYFNVWLDFFPTKRRVLWLVVVITFMIAAFHFLIYRAHHNK